MSFINLNIPYKSYTWVAIGVGVGTMAVGAVQKGSANKKLKRLQMNKTPYAAPEEAYDAFNMATNAAQTGYSAESKAYLTNQSDRALGASLGSVAKMGGDPNDVAAIFDRSVQGIMKNTFDNELLRQQKFMKVYDTMANIGKEKTAEWADKEANLKDEMASQAMKVQAGNETMQSGMNMAISGYAAGQTNKLYADRTKALAGNTPAVNTTPAYTQTFDAATNNGLGGAPWPAQQQTFGQQWVNSFLSPQPATNPNWNMLAPIKQ